MLIVLSLWGVGNGRFLIFSRFLLVRSREIGTFLAILPSARTARDLQQQKEPASRAKATSKHWWARALVRASPPLSRRRTACRAAPPGGCRDRRLNPLAARSALLVFDFRWRFEDHRVDCVDGPALPIHLRPDGLEDHLLPREGPLALREIGSSSGHSSSGLSSTRRGIGAAPQTLATRTRS